MLTLGSDDVPLHEFTPGCPTGVFISVINIFFVLLYVHDIDKQMEINIVLYLMQCIFVHYRSCLKHTSKLNKIYNNTC